MNSPENLESEQNHAQYVEKAFEAKDDHFLAGAELLENPPDHSFQQGLQAFIAWVKSLVAPDDKT